MIALWPTRNRAGGRTDTQRGTAAEHEEMTMDPKSHLTHLAESVTLILVGGSQSPVTVTPLGNYFDTDRTVCVAKKEERDDGPDQLIEWVGPVSEWVAACRAVLQK